MLKTIAKGPFTTADSIAQEYFNMSPEEQLEVTDVITNNDIKEQGDIHVHHYAKGDNPDDKKKREKEAKVKAKAKNGDEKPALDPVGKEDGDVDNDGDKDSSDKYLMKKRKAIGKSIKAQKKTKNEAPIKLSGDKEKIQTHKGVEESHGYVKQKKGDKLNVGGSGNLGASLSGPAGKGDFFILKKAYKPGQDQFQMVVIDDKGIITKDWGSHPSLNGAKKFAKNRGYKEEVELDEVESAYAKQIADFKAKGGTIKKHKVDKSNIKRAVSAFKKRFSKTQKIHQAQDEKERAEKEANKETNEEVVQIDEIRMQKQLHDFSTQLTSYAKKHGGIDKKYFEKIARIAASGKMPSSKDIDNDTDPRDFVLGMMAKSFPKEIMRNYSNISPALSHYTKEDTDLDTFILESSAAYEKSLKKMSQERIKNSLSASEKNKLGKISDMLKKANDDSASGWKQHAEETDLEEDKDPCWDTHKQVGMKKKNGKMVPNCVPKEEVEKVSEMSSDKAYQAMDKADRQSRGEMAVTDPKKAKKRAKQAQKFADYSIKKHLAKEEASMICKDCGCELDNADPNCDCPHDSHDAKASHWMKNETTNIADRIRARNTAFVLKKKRDHEYEMKHGRKKDTRAIGEDTEIEESYTMHKGMKIKNVGRSAGKDAIEYNKKRRENQRKRAGLDEGGKEKPLTKKERENLLPGDLIAMGLSKKKKQVSEAPVRNTRDYQLYHRDFSSAMQHAYDVAKKRGFTVDPNEIDRKVAMGPRKPGNNKTNRYILGTDKKQNLHVQVANLDNKRFELNMYIESVLDERIDQRISGNPMVNKLYLMNQAKQIAKQSAGPDKEHNISEWEALAKKMGVSRKDYEEIGDKQGMYESTNITQKEEVDMSAKGTLKLEKVLANRKKFVEPTDRAGEWGTDKLSDNYKETTPGQNLDEYADKQYKRYEAGNHHGKAAVYAWKKYHNKNDPKEVAHGKELKKINKRHEKRGHLSHEDGEKRFKISQKYTARMAAKHTKKEEVEVKEGNVIINDRDPYRIFENMVHYLMGTSIKNIEDYSFYKIEETPENLRLENKEGALATITLADVQQFYDDQDMTMDEFVEMITGFGVKELTEKQNSVIGDEGTPAIGKEKMGQGIYTTAPPKTFESMEHYSEFIRSTAEYQKNGFVVTK